MTMFSIELIVMGRRKYLKEPNILSEFKLKLKKISYEVQMLGKLEIFLRDKNLLFSKKI